MSTLGFLLFINIAYVVSTTACEVDPSLVQTDVRTRIRAVGDNVRLDCSNSQDGQQMVWKRNTAASGDETLFAGQQPLRRESHINLLYSSNYSLTLDPITADDEGVYNCIMCSQTVASYQLRVITALPVLRIQHGGTNVTGPVLVEKEEVVQLDCIVFGAIEEPTIVWSVRNATITEYTEATVKSSNQFGEGLFDFRKRLTYAIKEDTDLSCSSPENSPIYISVKIPSEEEEITITDFISTAQPKALPELRIQHEGANVTDEIVVAKETRVHLDCVVFRATEEPTIVWHIENTNIEEHTGQINQSPNIFVEGTLDFRKPLTYLIKDDTEFICSSIGNRRIILVTTFGATPPPILPITGKSLTYETPLIAAVCLTALIVSAVCLIVYLKRCRETRRSTTVKKKRPSNGGPAQEVVPLQGCQHDCGAVRKQSTRTLPEVPQGELSYAHKINEEDPYSEMSYNLPGGDVFSRKRVCMIHKLSDGVICDRWIGAVTTSHGEKKNAFISCLRGVIRNRHFQWEGLVKKISELPECLHIFRAQGICLDEPHLFLLQEYMNCEPLDGHISMQMRGQDARKSHTEFFARKFTDISIQLSYGMEFIMKHGLAHPGLSLKKVLINEEGVCKLFDFCLAEDAPKFMECLKLEADFKPSSHPQECVARNEHTSASDIWYTAFTVRELYSYGSQKQPVGSNLYYENSSTPFLPSGLLPRSVYERLTECLNQSYNERPMNLRELIKALKSDGYFTHVEPSKINTNKSSSYEPMNKGEEGYRKPLLMAGTTAD